MRATSWGLVVVAACAGGTKHADEPAPDPDQPKWTTEEAHAWCAEDRPGGSYCLDACVANRIDSCELMAERAERKYAGDDRSLTQLYVRWCDITPWKPACDWLDQHPDLARAVEPNWKSPEQRDAEAAAEAAHGERQAEQTAVVDAIYDQLEARYQQDGMTRDTGTTDARTMTSMSPWRLPVHLEENVDYVIAAMTSAPAYALTVAYGLGQYINVEDATVPADTVIDAGNGGSVAVVKVTGKHPDQWVTVYVTPTQDGMIKWLVYRR